jgi:ribose 5-phosphate isomerase A
MNTEELKALVARAALDHLPDARDFPGGAVVGVGTGSTVNHFIDALATRRSSIAGAVSSSEASTRRLLAHGIPVLEASQVQRLPVYVDGADEINAQGHMIKGGGAALTREKIVADLAERFICIVDQSKRVPVLGRYPVPVEVIGMALAQVSRRFADLGGRAVQRQDVLTDNGHPLLDVHGLQLTDPLAFEQEVNQWPGVVTVGVFARHRAHLCLLGTPQGVQTLSF